MECLLQTLLFVHQYGVSGYIIHIIFECCSVWLNFLEYHTIANALKHQMKLINQIRKKRKHESYLFDSSWPTQYIVINKSHCGRPFIHYYYYRPVYCIVVACEPEKKHRHL